MYDDDDDEVVCDVNRAVLVTLLSKIALINFLTWTEESDDNRKWLDYEILEKVPGEMFVIELTINKQLAVFYKKDFDTLMFIIGFVMPEYEVVCQQCSTKMEKNFDVSASCPKCGLERLEKVPVQKRERIV